MILSSIARATAILVVPLLVGVGYLFAYSPEESPGVYAQLDDGHMYFVSGCPGDWNPASIADAREHLGAFYVVVSPTAPADVTAQIVLQVVDYRADALPPNRLPIKTQVRRLNRRVIHIAADGVDLSWQSMGPTNAVLREALALPGFRRATTGVLVVLELSFSGQLGCSVAVSLSPPAWFPDSAIGWIPPMN